MVEGGGFDLAEVDEDGKTAVHIAAGHRHCHEVGETTQQHSPCHILYQYTDYIVAVVTVC